VVELERREDLRGFFARTFDADVFRAHGLEPAVSQCNLSWNSLKGTLRGMHYQTEAAPEAKYIRCTSGAVHDVIIDLRPASPSYLKHVGVELTAENHRSLFVPPLCAHGYLTLTDGAEVAYQVSAFYTPGAEVGVRYDDPIFQVEWPLPVEVISTKDAAWPAFTPERRVREL
jgi:dTDP-4-dehydrorhamnose 3,5-epimerase